MEAVSIRGVEVELTIIDDPAGSDLSEDALNACFVGTDEMGNLVEGVWT